MKEQQQDSVREQLAKCRKNGWQDSRRVLGDAPKPLWYENHIIAVEEELLIFANRVIEHDSLYQAILPDLHTGYVGVTKTEVRAKEPVWCPGTGDGQQQR